MMVGLDYCSLEGSWYNRNPRDCRTQCCVGYLYCLMYSPIHPELEHFNNIRVHCLKHRFLLPKIYQIPPVGQ
ncbi:hypothetical protein XELAEV_18027974mg [Xenopus laevis]|uniref:Uncharacterized protein n=1 Tax=Xenopus laevis TaxID=8355 RepID=A0A974CZ17_XENLA|nr:hypothetical protein XELAEV_18027974mg [Xenopus laevis]